MNGAGGVFFILDFSTLLTTYVWASISALDGFGVGLVADLGFFAIDLGQLEGQDRLLGGLEIGVDSPVFDRNEFLDFVLALADHLERHRLNSSGR